MRHVRSLAAAAPRLVVHQDIEQQVKQEGKQEVKHAAGHSAGSFNDRGQGAGSLNERKSSKDTGGLACHLGVLSLLAFTCFYLLY